MNILSAYQLAAVLHTGQVDKAGRPYIEHLTRVFLLAIDAGGDRSQQIAALLHDAIEDGKATPDDLRRAGVPEASVEMVLVLTRKSSQPYDGYIREVKLHPKAALIKLADLADNFDPARLSLLPPEVANRLAARYSRAISILKA